MSLLNLQRLDVVSRTRDRVCLEERPHVVIGPLFLVFGILIMVLIPTYGAALVAKFVLGSAMCALGLLGLVRTTISATRKPGVLEVRRQLGPAMMARQYPVKDIVRTFERRTFKGNGLRVELVGGRKKNLTLWTQYSSLYSAVGDLNYFIQLGRKEERLRTNSAEGN